MAVKPVANPSYEPLAARQGGYQSFTSFYPFYLGEVSVVPLRYQRAQDL